MGRGVVKILGRAATVAECGNPQFFQVRVRKIRQDGESNPVLSEQLRIARDPASAANRR
jgi:hypothetical protein